MALVPPVQRRSIDPYSEDKWSDSINRLTRIFTNGKDVILNKGESFEFSTGIDTSSNNYVAFSSGTVIKDDILIHVTEEGYVLYFDDDDNYLDEVPGMLTEGWYYVVLWYNYDREYPPPQATLRILRETSIFETYSDNYIFLAAVQVVYNNSTEKMEIADKKMYDPNKPSVKRQYLTMTFDVED
jgi:hypothetical protein